MIRAMMVAALALTAGAAFAKPPLKDVTYVREGLITAGMAIEIDNQCDALGIRLIRGYSFLADLKSHARGLGYTADEIDAYVDDKVEKARLEGIARQRLADLGAVATDPASYCTVGRAQIAAGSQLGSLIR